MQKFESLLYYLLYSMSEASSRDFYPECSTEIRDRKLTWAEGDVSQYEIQLNA